MVEFPNVETFLPEQMCYTNTAYLYTRKRINVRSISYR